MGIIRNRLPTPKTALTAAVVAASLTAGAASTALAAGRPTTWEPGAPNCHGQFIAASNNNSGISIGQVSHLPGVPSVKDLQKVYVAEACAPTTQP